MTSFTPRRDFLINNLATANIMSLKHIAGEGHMYNRVIFYTREDAGDVIKKRNNKRFPPSNVHFAAQPGNSRKPVLQSSPRRRRVHCHKLSHCWWIFSVTTISPAVTVIKLDIWRPPIGRVKAFSRDIQSQRDVCLEKCTTAHIWPSYFTLQTESV